MPCLWSALLMLSSVYYYVVMLIHHCSLTDFSFSFSPIVLPSKRGWLQQGIMSPDVNQTQAPWLNAKRIVVGLSPHTDRSMTSCSDWSSRQFITRTLRTWRSHRLAFTPPQVFIIYFPVLARGRLYPEQMVRSQTLCFFLKKKEAF